MWPLLTKLTNLLGITDLLLMGLWVMLTLRFGVFQTGHESLCKSPRILPTEHQNEAQLPIHKKTTGDESVKSSRLKGERIEDGDNLLTCWIAKS